MATDKKQSSVYLTTEDEQNIETIRSETSLKKQNDIICYSLKFTADSFRKSKGYINEKALADFTDLMIANGLEVDMIRSIVLNHVDRLVSQHLKKYS